MRFPFCQFIAGEPSFNDACKCGRKVKPGTPYCPEHHTLCTGRLRPQDLRLHLARLADMGISETEQNINNKLSRGGFSVVFLIQCLIAAGCHTVRLSED